MKELFPLSSDFSSDVIYIIQYREGRPPFEMVFISGHTHETHFSQYKVTGQKQRSFTIISSFRYKICILNLVIFS